MKDKLYKEMIRVSNFYLMIAIAIQENDAEKINKLQEEYEIDLCYCDELKIGVDLLGHECNKCCEKCLEEILR